MHRLLWLSGVMLISSTVVHANALDHFVTSDVGLNKAPHLGTSHILVIPSAVNRNFSEPELTAMQTYFDPAGGPGTFRHYWQTNSNGMYDPIPTLVQPVIYLDHCPIPGKTLTTCTFTLNDLDLITSGALKTTFEDVILRVRDEQNVDLAQFDVNTGTGPGQDGYFDGILMHTDIYAGIGFPLGAFDNAARVSPTPGVILPADAGIPDGGTLDAGPVMTCGIVALAPPDNHEYGHTLGFIDLYGGPTLNDLMVDMRSTLGAFSRQQIGWGTVMPVTGALELDLAPVLQGGVILRFGDAPRYLLVENRGGDNHALYDQSHAGIYVYSIDETKLPSGPLGFVDIFARSLYLPNKDAPYLDVNVPLNCNLGSPSDPGTCALSSENEQRVLRNAAGDESGFTLKRGATQADGTVHVSILVGSIEPPDAGAPDVDASVEVDGGSVSPSSSSSKHMGCLGCSNAGPTPWILFLGMLSLLRRKQ